MNIILASASPRRRELLQSMGVPFRVIPSSVEEVRQAAESPHAYVRRLASEKAGEVAERHPEAWVIGADTIVFVDGEVLEKPRDVDDAARMLRTIAGRNHCVFTGLTLQRRSDGREETVVAESTVTMIELSDQEIEWYVATGEPLDKAGGYAVQGVGAMFIERVEGSYTNVVGLPLAMLFGMMKRAGIHPLHLPAGAALTE